MAQDKKGPSRPAASKANSVVANSPSSSPSPGNKQATENAKTNKSSVKTDSAPIGDGDQRIRDLVKELVDRNVAHTNSMNALNYPSVPHYFNHQPFRPVFQPAAPEQHVETECRRNYDSDDEDMSCGHWCEYVIVVVLSSILLVASVVLVLFWCLYYRKGYAWNENPTLQFNLHPTLMITGFVFFSGFSMLLYRISRCCRRVYVKLLHTLFHTLAIPCVVLGFMAVLDSHNLADPPLPNFYSIHSWMGFVTMGLFALQFVVGFFSFLLLMCCDSATAGFRASLVPVHATFGLTTFMLAIATCLTGLTEKANSTLGANYANYPDEGIILNALAMVLVALGILISYAVRREPLRVHSVSYVSERL